MSDYATPAPHPVDGALGFSLAAADLLLELDGNFRVTYASGSARNIMGRDCDALLGLPFESLVSTDDLETVSSAFARLIEVVRPPPRAIHMADTGVIVMFGACSLPGAADRIFVALSMVRLPGHETLPDTKTVGATGEPAQATSRDAFITAARDLVIGVHELGAEPAMTLLDIPVSDDQDEGFSHDAERVTETLRERSLGGVVGRISDRVFAVVHERTRSVEMPVDPDGASAPFRTVDLNPGDLGHDDVAQLIEYVLDQFIELGPQKFDIASLSSGKTRFVRRAVKRLSDFQQTLFNDRFRIVFQPIVSFSDGTVHHYEVLSRFPDGEGPQQTVLFAESAGLIEDLDLAVCRKAIDVLHETHKAGNPTELAINISARSLRSGILVSAIEALLASLGALRKNLLLEITETYRIEDLVHAENVLQQFRRAGTPVCLDDFGAGTASFQYFQALTIDYAKIDGAYVKGLPSDRRNAAILRAMVGLCRDLNVGTVAEMVETEAQARELREMGVDYGQGWLFGAPRAKIDA